MKTYVSFCVLFVLFFLSCSKSDSNIEEKGINELFQADYVILLEDDDLLTTQFVSSNEEVLTLNSEKSSLGENAIPELSSIDGANFIQYHSDGSCNGLVTNHNFSTDDTSSLDAFPDLNDCSLNTTAIAKSNNFLFVSYELTSTNPSGYFVRVIDLNASEFSAIDISLDKKPIELAIANNRLFILSLDELVSDENSLSVMDISTNSLIHEKGLGYHVDRIFVDVQQNIIISYEELHSTVNSKTLAVEYTQYDDSVIAPNFSNSRSSNFDVNGKLYYPMQSGDHSSYNLVPAIYDFSEELLIIFAYENFLTEAKRKFEFEIETTTVVSIDEKNGILLVGYKKMNSAAKRGGLLRIKLAPEPSFIDNIDLDGVPYEIFVNQ